MKIMNTPDEYGQDAVVQATNAEDARDQLIPMHPYLKNASADHRTPVLRREKPQNDATVGADDFLSFFGGSSYAGKKLTGVLGDPTIPYSNVSKRTQGYCRFTVDDEKQKVKGWTWGKGGGVQEFSGCHFRTFNSGSDTPGKHAGRERTKSQCLYEMNLSKIRDRTHGIPSACTSGNYSEGNPCHEWLSKYGWCGKTWAHKDGGTDCRPETDVVRNKMINGSDDWWSCNWPNMEKSGDGCACKEGFWFNALLQECVRDEGGVDSIMDQWWTGLVQVCQKVCIGGGDEDNLPPKTCTHKLTQTPKSGIGYTRTYVHRKPARILGSDSWVSCNWPNMHTCSNGGYCCCDKGYAYDKDDEECQKTPTSNTSCDLIDGSGKTKLSECTEDDPCTCKSEELRTYGLDKMFETSWNSGKQVPAPPPVSESQTDKYKNYKLTDSMVTEYVKTTTRSS